MLPTFLRNLREVRQCFKIGKVHINLTKILTGKGRQRSRITYTCSMPVSYRDPNFINSLVLELQEKWSTHHDYSVNSFEGHNN